MYKTMGRVFLIVLPVILLFALYMEGQNYDPEVLAFRKVIFQSEKGRHLLPQNLNNWKLKEPPKNYTPENLFEYLNGHAEFYISRGLESLTVAEYTSGPNATAKVEVFRMVGPLEAWGVLQEEAPERKTPLKGPEGYRTEDMVVFSTGPFYVRVFSKKDIEGLYSALYNSLRGLSQEPDIITFLPEGTTGARYHRQAYMGIEGLDRVLEAELPLSAGRNIRVFLRKNTTRASLEKILQEFIQNGATLKTLKEGIQVEDPYEGTIFLVLKRDTLYGFRGEIKPEEALSLLKKDG